MKRKHCEIASLDWWVEPYLKSVRDKLSDAELAHLEEEWGLELRDPAGIPAPSEPELARERFEVLEAAARSSHSGVGEPVAACTFCGGTANSVGPVVQAPGGSCICKACAVHCSKLFQEGTA
jgi:hypothetical protein